MVTSFCMSMDLFPILSMHVSYSDTCYLLLIWSNQHDVINVMDQIFSEMPRWLRSLQTKLSYRAWDLRQPSYETKQVYFCPFWVRLNCVLPYFKIGIEKKACEKSIAVYQVPEFALICSSRILPIVLYNYHWSYRLIKFYTPGSVHHLHRPNRQVKCVYNKNYHLAVLKSLMMALIHSAYSDMGYCV